MRRPRWVGVGLAVTVALAAALTLGLLTGGGGPAAAKKTKFDKRFMERDLIAVPANKMDLVGNKGEPAGSEASDNESTAASWAEERAALRAYPADTLPPNSNQTAMATWKQYQEKKDGSNGGNNPNDPFVWNLIGPIQAEQPGVLSFSGALYHMAGRITAMAISPTCHSNSDCRLWIAAAGGGIWRTDNPFSPDPKWVFTSQSFDSNAIGSIDVDPNDPTGNTLYAGTGEPNASGDSEAGVGIYKTTNGGDTWTRLPGSLQFNARSIGKIAVQPGNPNHLIVAVARGVRGISSVTGGAVSRTGTPGLDGPDQAVLGVWETTDGGTTFNNAFNVAAISVRGANDVAFDPTHPGVAYAAVFQQGIFRRDPSKGEAQFTKIFQTGKPAENTSRTQFDVTTLPNGNTRIYATDGSVGAVFLPDPAGGQTEQPDSSSGVWRVDDANTRTAADLLATQNSPRDHIGWDRLTSATDRPRAAPGRETYEFCTAQCWYDQDVYTPAGHPDIVYVIGSYNYGELRGPSNARGVLLSLTAGDPDPTCKGCTFSDLTWDATPEDQPDQTHPDQHAIVTAPDNPLLYFEGSDGGVIRNDGKYVDQSDECLDRPLGPDSMILCQKLLSRIPLQIYDTLNKGLSTLQFQSVSLSPKQPLHDVQGGTQDNGTFDWDSQKTTWKEEIYGDGGQSGFNYCDDKIRFNEFFNQATDTNFQADKPTTWVITSGPLYTGNGGESAPFYFAEVSDYTNCGSPQDFPGLNTPAAIAANTNQTTFAQQNGGSQLGFIGFMYAGLNHVWRTVDNGGPQAYLEANCPEFFISAADPRCGDWQPLGGPRGVNQPGSLTGTFYGASKAGTNVSAIERVPGTSGDAWAATAAGRVFVTHNINAPLPQDVVWQRIDNTAVVAGQFVTPPPRFVSSIYPDPANPNHAWISFSGYNSTTPNTPGHVYEVTVTGATTSTWKDLLVENGTLQQRNGDIPVNDLVRDDYTGDLYASTDFGVLRDAGGQVGTWTKAGSANFPMVETPGLTIDPCSRVLYAATHGRSIWRMFLPKANAPNQPCPRTP
ncbi:MAG: hypothetical protein QOF50_394 [Gaiellaceae bacterium]|nr:hypothetical protein [Gaiellaceae bacterium]